MILQDKMKTLQVYPSELTEYDAIKISDSEIRTIKEVERKGDNYKIIFGDDTFAMIPTNLSVEKIITL